MFYSLIPYPLSLILCPSSLVTCHLSLITCHLKPVTCHLSLVTCQGNYISVSKSPPSWEVFHLLRVSKASSWSLRGFWRVLTGVLVVFDMVDAPRIHQGSYISIFISPPSWEVVHLLCVSRASSWSLRECWWFLTGVLGVFEMVDAPRIH